MCSQSWTGDVTSQNFESENVSSPNFWRLYHSLVRQGWLYMQFSLWCTYEVCFFLPASPTCMQARQLRIWRLWVRLRTLSHDDVLTICPNACACADGYIIAVWPLAACCGVTASGTLTAGAILTGKTVKLQWAELNILEHWIMNILLPGSFISAIIQHLSVSGWHKLEYYWEFFQKIFILPQASVFFWFEHHNSPPPLPSPPHYL